MTSAKKQPTPAKKQPTPEEPGLMDAFMSLADKLDEPFRTPAKKIVNILFFAIIAMLAIFLISSFAVALTDPQTSQLINKNKSILIIGAGAIGAIIGIAKRI
jgi:hypothetical protein